VSQILNFGIPSVIDIQIAGLDLENNREYSSLLLNRLKQIPGLVDARIRQSNRYPAFKLNIDRTRAKELGFTQQDVGNSLLISLSGDFQTAPNFWVDPTNNMSYQVNAQTPQYNIDTIQELMNTAITNVNVSSAPQILGAVASLERSAIPLVVSHYNVQPVIDIFAGVDGTDLGSVSRAINKILNETGDHVAPGTQVFVRGQIQMQQSTFQTLYFGLAFSILLIYMIIVINFQSWLDPFIIITALPGALAGIAWMLFFTHTHLSVPALTGAIMCMGVATSNSILMVSFARDKLAEGLEVKKAALEAGVTRLRPVLMTACAMIIGMIPMALGLGDGGEQNAPLGRAVIGGLSIATIATLFFVPSVFCIFHGRSIKKGAAHHDSMA
jgi:multidrug efflux pump subunit AcrB